MAERNREKIQVSSILVGLASPDEILSWSHGEVTKSETINYRTQKPEPDGLFCEKIFGPSKDYSCWCGKYKKAKDEGSICDKCGVEITTRAVRRERMGHIALNVPCTHIWYLKGIPSRIALVLDVPPKQLESVVYFNGHFMIDPGTSVSLNNISRPEHDNKEHKYKNKIIYIDSSPICREIMKNALVDVKNKIIEDGRQNEYDLSLVEDYIEHINDVQTFRYLDYVNIIGKYLGAKFGEGSEVVELLLKTTDLVAESQAIREELADASEQKAKKLIKRLECLESFIFSGNKPEWMILRILPVIPPDLRPLLPLDGGRFASTDVNELYRTIINRNNMLKRLKDQNAPRLMITSACRTLQEAVDALIDNGRRNGKPVTAGGGRPLKSLSGALKGKQGRFRQNLLGKRVDYSGRSVIAVGPSLKMFECGLPREMAIKLLRPFLVKELLDKNIYSSATQCDNAIDRQEGQVFDALDKIISCHPVLLNRAPTLHRLGIQAFKPVLVEGRAIRLHPLVCPGFNADFDGDQMAVHVPITKEAQEEALNIMLASRNILGPKDGKPICIPSQDMVLGNYYLTREESKEDFLKRAQKAHEMGDYQEEEAYKMYAAAEGKVFSGYNEIKLAYDSGKVHLHNRIAVRGRDLNKTDFTEEMKDSYLITTVGKVIFNNELPEDFPFINNPDKKSNLARTLPEFFVPKGTNIKEYIASKELIKPVKKKFIGLIIDEAFQRYKSEKTSVIVDAIKDLGFLYSTKYGLTISIADIKLSAHRDEIIKETEEKIEEINRNYDKGLLSNNERYQATINEWGDKEGLNSAKKKIEQDVKAELESDKNNPLYVLSDSGARGSLSNFAQLMGMRGLMANTKGVTIEIPVKSCFRQGLSTSEFFTGTHGARKGGADTALKTADSGYLTRRLVDVSHDVIVKEEDCGSDKGSVIRTIYEDSTQGKAIATLEDRAVGRYALEDIIDPQSGEIIVNANSLITDQDARNIKNAGITEIKIRSVFGCKAKDGVCVHCYGKSLATGNVVEVGQAVGVMAAQSIGEPGTQLTMRTFHTGGVAGGDITQGLPRVAELFEARTPKGQATITTIPGIVEKIEQSNQVYSITVYNDELDERETYLTNVNSKVIVKEGMRVESGQKLTAGNISLRDLLACTGPDYVENYIVEEIHKVYQPNGIFISDKHIEIIVRKMMSKIDVISSGDTNLLSGRKVSINEFTRANGKALIEGKRPAVGVPSILGITKAALSSDSFLSAASFQQTTSVLTDAAIKGKRDYFHGLKENVIGGKLIPAGRGLLSESEEKEIMDNFDVVDSINKIHKDYGLPLVEKDEPEEEPEDSIDSLRQNSELQLED